MCYEYYDFEARYREETDDGDTRCDRSCTGTLMDLDEQVKLGRLLLEDRVCRVCKERKNLLQSFYRVRKNMTLLSSYSYECKDCTVKRILKKRKNPTSPSVDWVYPDW